MKNIYLGNNEIITQNKEVKGQFVETENEKFYKISNYNQMPDFFMSIVSDSDHWMFLSSNGSLSAGRKNRNNALFPYYSDDKIHDYKNLTGSKTWCLVEKNNKHFLWEPFTDESEKIYKIKRNLYKSIYGNKIIFEEINFDLELGFQYGWYNGEKFGWIKKSKLSNLGKTLVKVDVVDGLRNILPFGIDYDFQNEYSNLLDAYKKSELLEESRLGLFMLSSIPVDRPEPSEALKTTTVWSHGLNKNAKILISDKQIKNFKNGLPVETETDVRASRGAYYINAELELEKDGEQIWYIVAEVNQDATDVANLHTFLKKENNLAQQLAEDITSGTTNLIKIVANADGLQMGNEELGFARHFSNTLFNVMRGGIYTANYTVDVLDFTLYVKQCNKKVLAQFAGKIQKLPQFIDYAKLLDWVKGFKNPELERICYEYLPLTFSRRHGDPSHPWNQFSIDVKNSDGSDKLNYQGNWRDIFQNWEALNNSFPEYIEGVICKFLNASTADGYNPYRITREGIDWEKSDPEDPWSYIGYWGDHQIIYLQKFLEQSNAFHPGKLDELMTKDIFVFANVPYRIKSFNEIVKNPKDTIVFDHKLNSEVEKRTAETGADGRLLQNGRGEIYRTNLTEKILITLLAKLSNFIPEAGIWLNTQRPEWNDANNALVGNGVSMVTLYYLRRFLEFWEAKFTSTSIENIEVSEEVKLLFDKILSLFEENITLPDKGFSDADRYHFTSYLGNAGSEFRKKVYANSFSDNRLTIKTRTLREFTQLALKYINHSIKVNKKDDGLYHSYNLISFTANSISVRHLYKMLEGQVAVLSSGFLSAEESLNVLDALKSSDLFREDQYSYLLYPNRELARFTEKNNIPANYIRKSKLLKKLVADGNTDILSKDVNGNYHFNSAFRNAGVLQTALAKLSPDNYGAYVEKEKESILNIFEEMFDHQSFTGRSGTFYGYEGLGSIYWHMVSKLLLAAQECYFKGVEEKANADILWKIKEHYYEIKAGIGLYKSPGLYGAFPTDAYSHTPGGAGVKQPGLTGQVKEDVISRFGELGIRITDGKITFSPKLLNPDEILQKGEIFTYYDLSGNKKSMALKARQLGFTFCQFPVVYTFGTSEKIVVEFTDGTKKEFPGNVLPKNISSKIFNRNREIELVKFNSQI
jgi:hypothetical protein